MIIYFERKADKDGKRRMEVTVEEFDVQRGKLYLRTLMGKFGEAYTPTQDESVYVNREMAVRSAIAWFDGMKKEIWPEETT